MATQNKDSIFHTSLQLVWLNSSQWNMRRIDVYDFHVDPLKGLAHLPLIFLASWDMDPGSVMLIFKYVSELNNEGIME